MADVEVNDMQGLIKRGYGSLPAAYYVMLRIRQGEIKQAKEWLKGLIADIATAESKKRTTAVNVAFTREGIRYFGLNCQTQFSCEFEDGMTSQHKQRILGDHGTSCPDCWDWGGPATPEIHLALLLYADDAEGETTHLDALYQDHQRRFTQSGLEEVIRLGTRTLIDRKEHFGFTDGVSQPILEGTALAERAVDKSNVLPWGEFVLGYKNAYDKYPDSPSIPAALDAQDRLRPAVADKRRRDFGRNGTYLVFRTLEQDVHALWYFLQEQCTVNGIPDAKLRDWLGAKIVGRWRSGVSLVQSPDEDKPELGPKNDFTYCGGYDGRPGDPVGLECPIGSHARRANPRDTVFPGSTDLVTDSNKHRILRRGRSYGEPVVPDMDPEEILKTKPDGVERGLHFLCINSDIGRQFEFVQHTWINNPRFANMYNELDPLAGDYGKRHRLEGYKEQEQEMEDDEDFKGDFSIPGNPIRRRLTGLTRYVHTRGGAYFFLPGIKALHVLAELPEPEPPDLTPCQEKETASKIG